MGQFLKWDKNEVFDRIDGIDISRSGNQIVTKYFKSVKSIVDVSDRYEIFDIKSFLKEKIEMIEENFTIQYYKLRIYKGVQEIVLLSDTVELNGIKFYKSFYILNSSDKSRRLNMNLGLYRLDNHSYLVGSIRNFSLSKKHLKGITKLAEETSQKIDAETFNEQIESIKSLFGQKVMLSNVMEVIVDKDLKVNHKKFDAFKNMLRLSDTDKIKFTENQIKTLSTPSEDIKFDKNNDIALDAFKVFSCYMQIFRNQDSYIVKKETEKILNITLCFIRAEKIKSLFI